MQRDSGNPIEKESARSDEAHLPRGNSELFVINEALRASEDRLKVIVNQSIIPIAECSLAGKFIFVNNSFVTLTGYSENDLYNKHMQDLIHPDDLVKYKEWLVRLANKGGAMETELRLVGAGGAETLVSFHSSELRDVQGRFSSLITTITDISHRRNEEEKNADILENLSDAFFAVDKDWRFTYSNHKAEELNNRAHGSLLGKNIWEEFPTLANTEFGKMYRKVAEQKTADSIIARSPTDHNWYEVHSFPAKDGIAAYFKNVTEKINAEEALRQSEKRYSSLLHQTTAGVVEMDGTGRHLFVNKKWCDITGFSEEELYKLTCFDYVHADDVAVYRKLFAQTAATGKPFINEKRVICKNGTEVWINETLSGISDEHAAVKSIVSVCIDITDRKTIEKQKDEFIGVASHELKTPITSLKAYTQILQMRFEKARDLTSSGMMQKMDGQINRLTILVQDLLDVTRLEGNLLQYRREVFEFSAMISNTIEEVQRTFSTHRIICKTNPKAYVFADVERTSQVLVNFLTNAAKYSPQADHIIVSVSIDTSYITCSVQDFGIGIPVESSRYIFDRFYRVSDSSRKTYPGLGLGLYIASEIVKKQQGEIWFVSSVHEGSVFSFKLPLYKQS